MMLDFTFEFNNEAKTVGSEQEFEMYREAQLRLRELADNHRDLTGAAMALEELSQGQETHYLYQCRVVVYARPENIAAVSKEAQPTTAVKQALSAIERQVREKRERLRERSREAASVGANEGLYELTAQEVYATYAEGAMPEAWLAQPRVTIAAQLMTNAELSQEDAYYAADQILAAATDMAESDASAAGE